jgi:hypothetical protein
MPRLCVEGYGSRVRRVGGGEVGGGADGRQRTLFGPLMRLCRVRVGGSFDPPPEPVEIAPRRVRKTCRFQSATLPLHPHPAVAYALAAVPLRRA